MLNSTAPRNKTEHEEQIKLVHIIKNHLSFQYPQLKIFYSVPNGVKLYRAIANTMILEGLTAGVPDLFLPYPSQGFHGLYIEMKSTDGKLSKHQKEFRDDVVAVGYYHCVPRSAVEALRYIVSYCCIPMSVYDHWSEYLKLSSKELRGMSEKGLVTEISTP